jgi:hypothetical protein
MAKSYPPRPEADVKWCPTCDSWQAWYRRGLGRSYCILCGHPVRTLSPKESAELASSVATYAQRRPQQLNNPVSESESA